MAKGSKPGGKSGGAKSKLDNKGKNSDKSGKSKQAPEANLDWEENLEKEIISDARWKCNVTLLNETDAVSSKYLPEFQEFSSLGKRQVVKVINLKDIFSQIKQEARGENKDGVAHPLQGVCVEVAKQLANEELSLQMFAKYIKFKIICLKEAEIRRKKMLIVREIKIREELMKQGLDQCPAELIKQKMAEENEAEMKGKKGGKDKKGGKEKGEKSDKKGNKTEKSKGKKTDDIKVGKEGASVSKFAPENSEKLLTSLRKEGEEWLDIRDIDDAPTNGAELYVVLIGLNDPNLLMELVDLNVPINGIIKVAVDPDCPPPVAKKQTEEELRNSDSCEESDEELNFLKGRRSSLVNAGCGKEKHSLCSVFSQSDRQIWHDDELAEKDLQAKTFWTTFELLKKDRQTATRLKDIAVFDFTTFNYQNCNFSSEEYGKHKRKLFDDICHILYKLEETSRLHIKYTRGMKLVDIDDMDFLEDLDDMEIYNTMSRMLPLECATPEFILHCLTEQVAYLRSPPSALEIIDDISKQTSLQSTPHEANGDQNQPEVASNNDSKIRAQSITTSENTAPQSIVDIQQERVELARSEMNNIFDKLNTKYGLSQVPIAHVAKKDPLVILNNDEVTQKTHHVAVAEVDLVEITSNMLVDGPVTGLWRQFVPQTELDVAKFNQHIFKLWHCMDGSVTLNMLKSYLHLLICEKMICFTADKNKDVNQNLTDDAKENDNMSMRFASLLDLLGVKCSSSHESQLDEAQIIYKTHFRDMEGICEMFGSPKLASLTGKVESLISEPPNTSRLKEFNTVEYYNRNAMLQCLANAYEMYNCLDYHYYAPTDSVMLNFHNSQNDKGVMEKTWTAKLSSPVAFADFKMYVIPDEIHWVQKVLTAEVEATNAEALNLIETTNEVDELVKVEEQDLMLRGSIKLYDRIKAEAEDIERERQEERAEGKSGKGQGGKKDKGGNKKEKQEKSEKSKKDKESVKESKKGEKGKDKKGKGKDKDMDEVEVELPCVPRLSLRCAREDEPVEFLGYNLGNLRVQVNGKTTWFYSRDGTEVRVDNFEHLYGKLELLLNIIKHGHTLTFHSYTGPYEVRIQTPLIFHLTSVDGIVFAFGKHIEKPTPLVEVPVVEPEKVESIEEKVKKPDKSAAKGSKRKGSKATSLKSTDKKSDTSLSRDEEAEEANKPVQPTPAPVILPWEYDLRVSWPSGLYIETMQGNTKHSPFTIKQRYLRKGPHCNQIHDEDYRIFQRNGTVLKFMTNGFVQILSQDSSIVLCRGFEKYAPKAEPPPDVLTLPKAPSPVSDGCYENVKPHAPYPPYPPPPLFVPPSPYLDITDYHVVLPNGTQYSVLNKVMDENHEKFLFRQATDYFLGEVFTRRGDGVNTLLKPDGSLVVVFTDGTRITTYFTVDAQPVRVEWTDEEKADIIARIAFRKEEELIVQSETTCAAACDNSKSETNSINKESLNALHSSSIAMQHDNSASNSKSHSTSKEFQSSLIGKEFSPSERLMFLDEGFLMVNLVSCMEHPNYATVSYFGNDSSAKVAMPNKMEVRISAEGHHEVHCDPQTTLQVKPDQINFDSYVCRNCNAGSKTYINLTGFDLDNAQEKPKIFCKTSDSFGKAFQVNYDGTTRTITGDEYEYEEKQTEPYCLPVLPVSHERRSFVLNRDLSGSEFYNSSDIKNYLIETRKKTGAIVVTDMVPNKSELKYHTSLEPHWKTQSEKWLMEYKHKNVLPNHMVKKDFSSTYGDPPSWFHPFPSVSHESVTSIRYGADGRGDSEVNPEVFTLRIIHDMQPGDQTINAIDIIQRALRKYWLEAGRKFEAYKQHVLKDPRSKEEKDVDDRLMDLAMGTSEVCVVDLGRKDKEIGLRPSLGEFEPVKPTAKWHPKFMEEFRDKTIQNEKDKQTYLELLRTQNVTPYFDSVAGRLFLMAQKAVEDASNTYAECGKNIRHVRQVINDIIRDNQELEEEELAEVLEREMACRLCYCKDQTQCRSPNVL